MKEQYNVTKWYLGGIVIIQQIILLIALKVIFLPSRYLYSLLFNNPGQVAVATVRRNTKRTSGVTLRPGVDFYED